ncbi:hypothetical protein BJ322DRAFT_1178833 [Thelephora terrestris]|uniref:Uncharacterized protein n=1 Tax=Thelephora terrestris TaxID=56493 RepID=A0A9P6HMY9_9AGAM|nr:hypothetical protein BJ322DRAFT_1178833 [Thelephora terrestris]
MAPTSQRKRGREDGRSTLDSDIQDPNHAMATCGISTAQGAFGSAGALLTTIRDSMADEEDCVDLGRTCADVCKALDRGLGGKRPEKLSQAMIEAIEQLTTTLATIREEIVKRSKRNVGSRLFRSKGGEDAISGWKQDLSRILQVFHMELSMNNHTILVDLHSRILVGQETAGSGNRSTRARLVVAGTGNPGSYDGMFHSVPVGEFPPPPPRACFGRGGLIDEVVGFAQILEPIALIGAGGVGKTSIALTVLHDDRVKKRFGGNRRFIRCDQFPAWRSGPHFLARLSKVIGAGIENPEDMASLRPTLSSQQMIIVLDNAESILDPQGPNHEEIYAMVDELCRFETICLCITSRITTVPRHCKRPQIPTLPIEAACDIFYGICGDGRRSRIIDNLLQRLDFHALSITLLATTASDNMWDYDRVADDGRTPRTGASDGSKREPGSNDRIVAHFPYLPWENLDRLFPTIPDRRNIFDKFCILSLTYRSNGFITMLAPLRDYLRPRDPISSPFFCSTKDHYFNRLPINFDPDEPGFEEARWIKSEDVNIEHLLDVLTSIYADTHPDAWDACVHFMRHLYWHKPRQTVLKSKIKSLPDSHPSKARCLFQVSRLFESVGNRAEQKRLLAQEKVIHHFMTALRIASAFDWHDELFSIHEAIARQFRDEGIEARRCECAHRTSQIAHG